MSKRYSGKSFKDSSVSKKPKKSLREKRRLKREKTKKWKVEREGGRAPTASDAAAVVFEVYQIR